MTPAEVGDLLRYLASTDSRNLTDLSVSSWHDLLSEVPCGTAERAVREHYRYSTDRIMPVHIHRFWRAEKEAEVEAASSWTPPPRGRTDPERLGAIMGAFRATLPQGRVKRKPGEAQPEVTPEQRAAAERLLEELRTSAWPGERESAACPFRDCRCTHAEGCVRGWLENSDGTVRPCPTCRPEQARIVSESPDDPGPARLAELRDRSRFAAKS